MDKPDKRTAKKRAFIKALKERGNIRAACATAKVGRTTVYEWKEQDVEFAKAWEEAYEDSTEVLEESLFERGLKGDTTAAIFLLKGRKPEMYRERVQLQHEGRIGLNIIIDGDRSESDG